MAGKHMKTGSKPTKRYSETRRSDDHDRYDYRPEKKKKSKAPIIIISVIMVILIAAGAFIAIKVLGYLNLINYDENRNTVESYSVETLSDKKSKELLDYEDYLKKNSETISELPSDKNVTNILLIGTDNRSVDEAGRSDSMMVISINTSTKKIVVTSIMRDLYVEIPGYDHNRINAAYAFGGPKLLIETIEQNFHIPIDRYAKVDFFSFIEVIDVVGGVDLNVYAGEIEVMQKYIRELNKLLGRDPDTDMLYESDAGKLHLNGVQALAYCRNRYSGNADFERTNRQRKVLEQVFKKAKKLSIFDLDKLANSLLPNITTDMTKSEVLSLIFHAKEYLDYDKVDMRIPMDNTWHSMTVDGMDVLGMDIEKNYNKWKSEVYPE